MGRYVIRQIKNLRYIGNYCTFFFNLGGVVGMLN